MREARHGTNTVWFHLEELWGGGKSVETGNDSWGLGAGPGHSVFEGCEFPAGERTDLVLLMAWNTSGDWLLLTPSDVRACSGGPQPKRAHLLGPGPLSGLQK